MEVASNVLGKEKEDRATLLNERNGHFCKIFLFDQQPAGHDELVDRRILRLAVE